MGPPGFIPSAFTSVLPLSGALQPSSAVSGSTAFVPLHAGLFAFAISSMEHWLFEHKNAWTRKIMWDARQQHLLPYGVLRGALAHCAFSVTLVLIAAGLVSAWRRCMVVMVMNSAGALCGKEVCHHTVPGGCLAQVSGVACDPGPLLACCRTCCIWPDPAGVLQGLTQLMWHCSCF